MKRFCRESSQVISMYFGESLKLESRTDLTKKLRAFFDKQCLGVLSTQKRNRPYASLVAFAVNFSLALNESLQWFQEDLPVAAVLGSLFGPLAYFSASRLGAIEIMNPVYMRLVPICIPWSVAMPLMSLIAKYLYPPYSALSQQVVADKPLRSVAVTAHSTGKSTSFRLRNQI
jgi:hypothetical protein